VTVAEGGVLGFFDSRGEREVVVGPYYLREVELFETLPEYEEATNAQLGTAPGLRSTAFVSESSTPSSSRLTEIGSRRRSGGPRRMSSW